MKKIGIVTIFEAINYGAVLQAYATQKKIELLFPSEKVFIINYRPDFINKDLLLLRYNTGKGLKKIAHFVWDLINIRRRKRKLDNFAAFVRDNFSLSTRYSREQLINEGVDLDIAISGSDQIWNPRITGGDSIYFLNFKLKDCSKISYATSSGEYSWNDKFSKQQIEFLKDYKSLSVREEKTVNLINKYIDNSIECVLDPTLLLTSKEWEEELPLEIIKEQYVFVFSAASQKTASMNCKIAKKIAREKNWKVYAMGMEFVVPGVHRVKDESPTGFVSYIKNAEVVITDSFHGTAFAINFGRNFISTQDFVSTVRQKNLLEMLDLSDHFLDDFNNDVNYESTLVRYEDVYDKLENNRTKSIEFLKGAIENG